MKKKVTKDNLLMFIRLTVLGLKANMNYSSLGDELEKSYNDLFDEKLI